MLRLSLFILVGVTLAPKEPTAAYAQEVNCILSDTECTCAELPSSGSCSNPSTSGMCILGDCQSSYKCDCMGYEKCARSVCGKWTPASKAILSRIVDFKCTYETNSGKCQTKSGMMETMKAAEHAEQATIAKIDESLQKEAEMNEIIADVIKLKEQSFQALNNVVRLKYSATTAEVDGLTKHVDDVVEGSQMITKEFVEARGYADIAYESMSQIRKYRTLSLVVAADIDEKKEKLNDVRNVARENGEDCGTCASLEAEINEVTKTRSGHTKTAVEWAEKTHEACRNMDLNVASIQFSYDEIKKDTASAVAQSQEIIIRLGRA